MAVTMVVHRLGHDVTSRRVFVLVAGIGVLGTVREERVGTRAAGGRVSTVIRLASRGSAYSFLNMPTGMFMGRAGWSSGPTTVMFAMLRSSGWWAMSRRVKEELHHSGSHYKRRDSVARRKRLMTRHSLSSDCCRQRLCKNPGSPEGGGRLRACISEIERVGNEARGRGEVDSGNGQRRAGLYGRLFVQ